MISATHGHRHQQHQSHSRIFSRSLSAPKTLSFALALESVAFAPLLVFSMSLQWISIAYTVILGLLSYSLSPSTLRATTQAHIQTKRWSDDGCVYAPHVHVLVSVCMRLCVHNTWVDALPVSTIPVFNINCALTLVEWFVANRHTYVVVSANPKSKKKIFFLVFVFFFLVCCQFEFQQ